MKKLSLVLLPGMDGTGDLFAPLVSVLRQDFDVHVMRYPTQEPLGYTQLEERIRAQLPQQPYALLGESFSGPIAISIAAAQPEQVKGLILSCSFARNPYPWSASSAAERFPVKYLPQWLINYAMLRSFKASHGTADFPRVLAAVSPAVLRERIRAALHVDVSSKLAQLRMPLLYLRARRDLLLPAACARHIQQLAPQTEIVEIDGPHLLLQTRPEEATRAIRRFLGI